MILLSYDKSGYRDKSGHRDKTAHRDKRGHPGGEGRLSFRPRDKRGHHYKRLLYKKIRSSIS